MNNYLQHDKVEVAGKGYGKVKEDQLENGLVEVKLESGEMVKVLAEDVYFDFRQSPEDVDAAQTAFQTHALFIEEQKRKNLK